MLSIRGGVVVVRRPFPAQRLDTEPVEPRVAGPAEGDQSGRGVGGGAVMHDERIRSQADAAQVAATRQDPFPAPAEAGAGAAGAVVAGLAEPAAVEIRRSAGAAQGELFLKVGGHGGEARSALSFICDKGRSDHTVQ